MGTVKWLHLSDWHHPVNATFSRRLVFDQLKASLSMRAKIDEELSELDFAVFTGDVAFSGRKEEYVGAKKEFFEPVLKAVGLSPDKLIIVPGNHDANRDIIDKYLPVSLKKPLNQNQVEEWLTTPENLEYVLKPFDNFRSFVSSLQGVCFGVFARD